MRTALMLAALVFAPLTSHADTEADVDREMYGHARNVKSLKTTLKGPATADDCQKTIDKARTAKLPPTFELSGTGGLYDGIPNSYTKDGRSTLRIADAHFVCEAIAKLAPLANARTAIEEAQQMLEGVQRVKVRGGDTERKDMKVADQVRACELAVDTLTRGGIASIEISTSSSQTLAVAGVKSAVCGALTKAAGEHLQAAVVLGEQEKAEAAKRAKPYLDAKFTGDRLKLMLEHHGDPFFAIGGRQLESVKARKTAGVMFRVTYGKYGIVTYHRYQFSGDKLVKSTRKEYALEPGAAGFR
jgi:hypothetical protein